MEKKQLKKFSIALLIFLSGLMGCQKASTNIRVYEKNELKNITSWQIELAYIKGEEERKQKGGELSERKVTHYGESPRDLQLLDDLIFYMKGDYQIDIQKNRNDPSGYMRIHPLKYNWSEGVFLKSLNISFYNNSNKLIAQVKIRNGNRIATVLEDEEFAKFAAGQLADILK